MKKSATASIYPSAEQIYSEVSYLKITYRGETKVLTLSIFLLYSIPPPPLHSDYPLITFDFIDLSDAWLPTLSQFKFSDNFYDAKYLEN